MTQFIAFVSGKGGAGKTTSAINVGQALVHLGQHTVVVDGNLATPHLAFHGGLAPESGTLNQFLRKEKDLRDIIHLHPGGLRLIPASPSADYSVASASLSEVLEHLENTAAFVLIDAPGGSGQDVSHILQQVDEALVIVNPTLPSVRDALQTIAVAKSHSTIIAGLILNGVHGEQQELPPAQVAELLGYPILATIKDDRKIRRSLHQGKPLSHLYPRSPSAREFQKVAQYLTRR